MAVIHITDKKSVLDSGFIHMVKHNMMYSQPRRIWQSEYVDEGVMVPCEDINREFWKENVPVIQF